MKFDERLKGMETKILLTTSIFFNIVSTIVFSALILMMLVHPERIADKTRAIEKSNLKNFLGVD